MQWADRIGRRVKLRDLHVFLAVTQCGSMAKAAEKLAVSQPVISKTISELEHALGVQLLDRTHRGVEPTAYGRAFITCGTAVFDQMRRGVQEIEFLSDPTVGELRIGSTSPLMEDLFPKLLEEFTVRYPRIICHTADGDTPSMNRLLRERKVDFVVSRTWGSHFGDDFAAEYLFDESMFVVAGLDSRWLRRRKINFKDLLDDPWVLPESDNLIGALINENFRRAGVALPAPRVVSNSMAVRTRLVESGRFLTLLPGSMLHFGASRLRLKALPIALPLESQPVEIITLRDRTPNPIAELFTNELRAHVAPLRKQDIGSKRCRATVPRLSNRGRSPTSSA